jgi:hypothetical protein
VIFAVGALGAITAVITFQRRASQVQPRLAPGRRRSTLVEITADDRAVAAGAIDGAVEV